ncbi:hypothetical protein [Burkholderia sp. Ax-1719]|uniref:hypothetical protein n=1 Tax=Burkholderia sp. Ax-1719 TaxID=2608334 RepID=UPI001421DC4F|nr:hypothetical protein [Burkholderia sp. Ax-1719]NIE68935.1 hypothetical protein [Burkholderia sp. Ax-1719]
MIFNVFLNKLLQKISGKREGGIVTAVTGYSPRAVKRLEENEGGVATVLRAILERKRASLMKEGASLDEASVIMAQIPSFAGDMLTPRPFGDLAFLSPGATQGHYSQTRSVARRLDDLSERLAAVRGHEPVDAARQILEAEGFLSPLWFADTNESSDSDPAAWRALFAARTWEEIDAPLRIFACRALFDWLACWDVDFYLSNFGRYTPRSVFSLVTPQLSPRVQVTDADGQGQQENVDKPTVSGGGPRPRKARRGLIVTPSSRLLEVSATLLAKLRLRKWPVSTPKLADLALWSGEDAGWLAKVGAGERPLPFSKFEQLWDTAATTDVMTAAGYGAVSAPFPLYAATQAFELLLVRRRNATRSVVPDSFIILGEDLYPWEARLEAARAGGAAIGSEPWPTVLG